MIYSHNIYVHVRMYVSVMLRNVNLRSRSECHFTMKLGQRVTKEGEDSAAGPSQCTYIYQYLILITKLEPYMLRTV